MVCVGVGVEGEVKCQGGGGMGGAVCKGVPVKVRCGQIGSRACGMGVRLAMGGAWLGRVQEALEVCIGPHARPAWRACVLGVGPRGRGCTEYVVTYYTTVPLYYNL